MYGKQIRAPKLSIIDLYNHHREGLHSCSCSKFRTNISSNVYGNFGVKCIFSTTFMDADVW